MNKILVVDDHEIFRSGLVALLTTVYDSLTVMEASSASEGESLFRSENPDLVILDHEMPGESGLDLFRRLKEHNPDTRAIFLTGLHSGVLVRELQQEGAVAVLGKSGTGDELLSVIDRQFSGESYVSEVFSEDLAQSRLLDSLTRREKEALKLLLDGCTTQQMADAMGIGYKTAETHRTRVMAKLDVHSYPELVARAQAIGFR